MAWRHCSTEGPAVSPTVCCVMLVNGREAMVRRAIASFRAQTYERKRLLIWDSSPGLTHDHEDEQERIFHMPAPLPIAATIGALRNEANRFACLAGDEGELIAHWDSDDWSHPRRLEEQVALLEASSKMCVGYRELLFWDTRGKIDTSRPNWMAVGTMGEAWIYRNHQANWAAGASLLYRRELWEQQPFDDAPHEDQRWMMTPAVSVQCLGISSVAIPSMRREVIETGESEIFSTFQPGALHIEDGGMACEPRMVCGIHGSNSEAYDRRVMLTNPDVWRRAPEFDEYCERVMRI